MQRKIRKDKNYPVWIFRSETSGSLWQRVSFSQILLIFKYKGSSLAYSSTIARNGDNGFIFSPS